MSNVSILLSSALAGSLARIPMHPIDTMKSRLQSSNASVSDIFRTTMKAEGIRGFYRGFWFTFALSMPGSCIYFTSQEFSRKHIFSHSLLSGFFAEAVACSVFTPVDVIKERIQSTLKSQVSSSYNAGAYRAFQHIVQTEGIRGLYKGYFVTLLSFGPFSGLYFTFYEALRNRASAHYAEKGSIPAFVYWLSAGASGAAAAWMTTPLDLIKLRMQLDPSQSYFIAERNVWTNIKHVYEQGGVSGSFRGASTRVLYFAPFTAFTMVLFEVLKENFDAMGL